MKKKKMIVIIVLIAILAFLALTGVRISDIKKLTGENFRTSTNQFIWLEDGRTYELYQVRGWEKRLFFLGYKGAEMAYHIKEKSLQVNNIYRLKDRSSEELLLFDAGQKWYLGRMTNWSTYGIEQNLDENELIPEVLKKVFACCSADDILSFRITRRKPYREEIVSQLDREDDNSKLLLWKALTVEAVYQQENRSILANLKDEDEYDLTVFFSSGAILRLENIKKDCKGAKMEYCSEAILFSDAGGQILFKMLQ